VINIEYIAEQYRLRRAASKAWKTKGCDDISVRNSFEAHAEPTSLDNPDEKRS